MHISTTNKGTNSSSLDDGLTVLEFPFPDPVLLSSLSGFLIYGHGSGKPITELVQEVGCTLSELKIYFHVMCVVKLISRSQVYFISKIYIIVLFVWVFACLCICAPCACRTPGGQKRALELGD